MDWSFNSPLTNTRNTSAITLAVSALTRKTETSMNTIAFTKTKACTTQMCERCLLSRILKVGHPSKEAPCWSSIPCSSPVATFGVYCVPHTRCRAHRCPFHWTPAPDLCPSHQTPTHRMSQHQMPGASGTRNTSVVNVLHELKDCCRQHVPLDCRLLRCFQINTSCAWPQCPVGPDVWWPVLFRARRILKLTQSYLWSSLLWTHCSWASAQFPVWEETNQRNCLLEKKRQATYDGCWMPDEAALRSISRKKHGLQERRRGADVRVHVKAERLCGQRPSE